ncbi:hypothetical protein LTR95_001559 [Oleoguttula sp. CCFEE 5521]
MASSKQSGDNAELSQRLILETFGNLLEGFRMYNATGDHRTAVLRVQYLARLRLADLRTAPEGLIATQRMSDGTDKQLCVLTPPHMVAVRDVNGKWSRVQRRESVHGPAPYSIAFWLETIRDLGLPYYFLTLEHLTMHTGDTEGDHLSVPRPPPLHFTTDAEIHPSLGETAKVLQYPFVHDVAPNTSRVLSGRLTDDHRRTLGGRFPALLLDIRNAIVVIHPHGYLTLYSATFDPAIQQTSAHGNMALSEIDGRHVDNLPTPASFYEDVASKV